MTEPKPNILLSLFNLKCPRCRRAKFFKYKAYNLKHTLDMFDECPVCKQPSEPEPGFWYGTGYVSYALTIAISVATFIIWWVLFGFSIKNDNVLWWLGFNSLFLITIQPWLMRFSRMLYLYFFVRYDQHYSNTRKPKDFHH